MATLLLCSEKRWPKPTPSFLAVDNSTDALSYYHERKDENRDVGLALSMIGRATRLMPLAS
jgi:hypothetical protein